MTFTGPFDPDATLDHLERSLIAGRHDRRGFIKAMTATGLATTGLHAWADELDAMRANQNERAAKLRAEYDYGAAPAGELNGGAGGRASPAPIEVSMWILFARVPPPDAPYWPGRRWLAVVDAVLWPALWMVLATKTPWSSGIVGLLTVTWAMWSAAARVHRAIALNHRYRFTTWRWGRVLLGLMLFGVLLKFAS